MTKIKICGITNLTDALFSVRLGIDALGFIFAKSKRKIEVEDAEKIIIKLPPFLSKVGVFVDEKPEKVMEIALRLHLDVLQFHGEEDDEYLKLFKPVKIVKVIRVKDRSSIQLIENYKNADAILLDTYQKNKKGGTGKTFDWNLAIEAKKYNKPIILSGGLNPKNIIEAIKKVKPYAVDTSSGVELYPGKKDLKKLKEFVKIVKESEFLK
jgi:phosphoribosylanthranilate isomerase